MRFGRKDLDLPELYAYLAILFYMGLYIENDRRLYWSQNPNRPLHQPVISAMSRDRWLNIDRAWSISDPLAKYETVFDKVSFLFDFICNSLTN
jgi:Transposase IS4